MISFEYFKKLDIRIGEIKSAEKVEDLDRLYKLSVDLGDEIKTLLAGVAENYSPEELVGKQIPVLVNLEPRTIKGIESQGMLLAVDVEGKPVLLYPDEEVPNGSEIH